MKKLCKDLANGDVVETSDGKKRIVESVSPGILRGQKMINFHDGEWAHAYPNQEIELTA